MKNTKLTLSISSLILTAVFAGCGGGNSPESTVISPTETTLDLSGNAIDGYIQNATVKIGDLLAKTDKNGFWSIPDVKVDSSTVIEVSGGIDVFTGEVFEGVLKAAVAPNATEVYVTPLSTVVASVVASGISVENATQTIAKKLGVTVDALTTDPIARLSNGTSTQKSEAAKVIKKALVVQKMAETITKSAASLDADKDVVFSAVMNSVAAVLSDTTSEKSFDVVLQDTRAITHEVSTQLEADTTIEIENLSAKLDASADAALQIVNTVQAIKESDLEFASDVGAILTSKSKALEVVTLAVEKAVEKIAEASDIESIINAKADIEKTTQTIIMLGGVEGISSKMDTQAAILKDDKVLDASSFSESFLSDEVVLTQASVYTTLKESGMTTDMIVDVGKKISVVEESTSLDIDTIIKEVLSSDDSVEISTDAIVAINESVESSVENSKEAVLVAAEVTETIEPIVVAPEEEEPIIVAPEEEEPIVIAPEEEEPIVVAPEEEAIVTPAPTIDTHERSIFATGSFTANSVAEIFTIYTTSGVDYKYTITDFDTTQDKLNFGTGITSSYIDILNTADDGVVELCYTPNAGVDQACIILDGLTTAQDMALTTSTGLTAILADQ